MVEHAHDVVDGVGGDGLVAAVAAAAAAALVLVAAAAGVDGDAEEAALVGEDRGGAGEAAAVEVLKLK